MEQVPAHVLLAHARSIEDFYTLAFVNKEYWHTAQRYAKDHVRKVLQTTYPDLLVIAEEMDMDLVDVVLTWEGGPTGFEKLMQRIQRAMFRKKGGRYNKHLEYNFLTRMDPRPPVVHATCLLLQCIYLYVHEAMFSPEVTVFTPVEERVCEWYLTYLERMYKKKTMGTGARTFRTHMWKIWTHIGLPIVMAQDLHMYEAYETLGQLCSTLCGGRRRCEKEIFAGLDKAIWRSTRHTSDTMRFFSEGIHTIMTHYSYCPELWTQLEWYWAWHLLRYAHAALEQGDLDCKSVRDIQYRVRYMLKPSEQAELQDLALLDKMKPLLASLHQALLA